MGRLVGGAIVDGNTCRVPWPGRTALNARYRRAIRHVGISSMSKPRSSACIRPLVLWTPPAMGAHDGHHGGKEL